MVAHVYRIEDGLIRSMEIRSADRKEPMMSNTVQFHRVLRAAPEKVYRAFLDGDAMAKWVPPYGFTGKVHHMDAKVGGTTRCRSRISPPAAVTLSVENISNWCHTNAFATPQLGIRSRRLRYRAMKSRT
jgi:Activator of Hsp90 ATPase homolog 1-like protein